MFSEKNVSQLDGLSLSVEKHCLCKSTFFTDKLCLSS